MTKRIKSREYKVMLRADRVDDREGAIAALFDELTERVCDSEVTLAGKLKSAEKRIIRFLDTPDFTLRRSGLVLRRRDLYASDETQITLKCRSADRYLAQGRDLRPADDFDGDMKFEEDIAARFRSRFSRSTTITLNRGDGPFNRKSQPTLGQVRKLFPILRTLQHDGRNCSRKTRLSTVNGVVAHERVYKGRRFLIGNTEARTAVIVWTRGLKGRPLVAEFSFRYKDRKESYSAELASTAMQLFFRIQQLDWCAPSSPTKTQYVYGEG